MTFLESIKTCLVDKYATFSGRASRSEYWWFFLFGFMGAWVFESMFPQLIHFSWIPSKNQDLLDFFKFMFPTLGDFIFFLLTLVPSITVATRRLHDINRSGWWQLFDLTVIGIIPLLYLAAQKGTPGPNRFGEDPLQEKDNRLIEG